MIELDKRIIEGKKPLTAFDELDSKYLGTDCFFSDKPSDFADLSKCQVGKLMSLDAVSGMFGASKNNSYAVFCFCLPCEWIREEKTEPEPKYRPYTLTEFVNTYSLGDEVIMRIKNDPTIKHVLFVEYAEDGDDVRLGQYWYTFMVLFNNYETYTSEGWKPFGVLEND